jgi:hypothetical protein
MPKLPADAPKSAKKARLQEEMAKWKSGTLHSGSRKGPVVTSQRQAIAIALSTSNQDKKGRKSNRKSHRGGRR